MAGITKQEALEMIDSLSRRFNITPPRLDWSFRSKRGRAFKLTNRIACGPLCWRGAVASLLHEFAHVLVWRREALASLTAVNPEKEFRRRKRPHGPMFQQALEEVVIAWYGDLTQYPWKTEYKTVAAYGQKKMASKN